jgi:hypothetical protein
MVGVLKYRQINDVLAKKNLNVYLVYSNVKKKGTLVVTLDAYTNA